jgi:hypothetical protein
VGSSLGGLHRQEPDPPIDFLVHEFLNSLSVFH